MPAVDAWTLLASVVFGILVAAAARPLADPDIWWHVRAGQHILDAGIPRTERWSFTAEGRPWVLTAWLSDVALAALYDLGGWKGIVILKVCLTAALLLLIGVQLFRIAPGRIAGPVFSLTAIALSPFLTERPQLVSLLLTVWLTGLVRRVLAGRRPPWWTILVGYAWANLHGLWPLLPVALTVCAAGIALDKATGRRQLIVRCLAIAIATTGACALTPIGPRLVYWPFMVQRAAAPVSEWQATALTDRYAVFFLALFLGWVVAIARRRESTSPSEILWVISVLIFCLQAGRYLAPAVILLAPFTCAAMSRTFGEALARRAPPTLPRAFPAATGAVGLLVGLAFAFFGPSVVNGLPDDIVEELTSRTGKVRVLNSYVVGGYLTGMGAPKVSVAIDGRTDVYEPGFVRRYMLTTSTTAGWRELVDDLDPDVAVLGARSRLAEEMTDAGWLATLTDGDYVLLDHPPALR